MLKSKLTDAAVAKATLPEGRKEAVLWDSEVTGFGLRLRAATQTWIVYYRPAGAGRTAAAKRYKLGTPKTIPTATDARRLARDVLGRVARGEDPAAERAEQKRAIKSSVGELLDAYEAYQKERGRMNYKSVVSVIRRGLKPFLARDVKTLEGAALVEIVDKIAAGGQRGTADDFRSRCRAFLSWCRDSKKVISANPLLEHRNEKPTRAQKLKKDEHGRALSDDELGALWAAASVPSAYNRYVQFLILTGCRRTEASVVHHTGKDVARGARGHTILRAATDTEIEIAEGQLSVTKQRDHEGGLKRAFKLTGVALGFDEDGDTITSATVTFTPRI
ncbi:integrase arm-type DNA-binding domain-containing protein [Cypionkella sp. TWP1-2-1b2]|uniref:integrase arm-type DNA-binding domain-containing protein n=1 Tax=Cypionkella sp. TWP1-2-1b2 TaxID=2804675 RepID=UPI003CEEDF52